MSHLEYHAASWLWLEKRCQLVLQERNPRSDYTGEPDVLGVTKARYLLEIEVKRTLSDFRNNKNKRCMCHREHFLEKFPKQFWFMVPRLLIEKVKTEIPEWAGLLTLGTYTVQTVIPAPANHKSKRLSVKECIKLFRFQTNQLMSTQGKLIAATNGFESGYFREADYVI